MQIAILPAFAAATAALAVLVGNPVVSSATLLPRPNIIHILTDDLRRSGVGFLGCKDMRAS